MGLFTNSSIRPNWHLMNIIKLRSISNGFILQVFCLHVRMYYHIVAILIALCVQTHLTPRTWEKIAERLVSFVHVRINPFSIMIIVYELDTIYFEIKRKIIIWMFLYVNKCSKYAHACNWLDQNYIKLFWFKLV